MRALVGDTLLFATHNSGKVDEMRAMLAPFGVSIISAADKGLAEPAETETSFVGNARIKAHAAAQATGIPALADDSGLCVEALDGAPGVFTANWAEGPDGRDFLRAMNRTHEALMAAHAPQPWTAEFRCTLVLAWPDGFDEVFDGSVRGQLVWPLRGELGHGYDPMFMPDGYNMTFAQMDAAEKNTISHRSRAVRSLVANRFT